MYYPFSMDIEVDHFYTLLYPMVSYVPVFGAFRIHERADDSLAVLLLELRGLLLSRCGWSMTMRVCQVGNISFPSRNISTVSASDA